MNANIHDFDGHDAAHHDHHDGGAPHVSMSGYMTGFGLSVVLTAIPFWLVMAHVLPTPIAGLVIMGFAAVQVVVHMIYFLHMNGKVEGGWSLLALAFTIMVLAIMIGGSMWVMYHLNHNMMPMSAGDMRNMP